MCSRWPEPGTAPRRKSALRCGALRVRRGFLQVDPVVVRSRQARIDGQRTFEQAGDLGCPWPGRAVRRPPVVGVQVEQCLGRQQRHQRVARVALRQRAHALRVGGLVGDARLRVAQRQRLDQRAPRRRGAVRMASGLGHGAVDASRGLRRHVGIDRRAQRPGQRPPAAGAGRVDGQRRIEGPRGFFGIEAEGEQHALVEVAPHPRIARLDREVVAVETGQQRRHGRRDWQGRDHR